MNKLRLSTGHEVPLDGDLLAVLEGLVEQMSHEDRRRYLVESLFLNYNTYESEMLDAYWRRLTAKKKGRRAAGGGR